MKKALVGEFGGRDFFGMVLDVLSVPRPGAWEKEDVEDEGFEAE